MIQKGVLVFALTTAMICSAVSFGRQMDTSFLDAVRKAFTTFAAERGIKPNNKFNQAVDEVEKAIAALQGHGRMYKFNIKTVRELTDIVERAAKSGNMESFRQALGRALYANLTVTASKKKNKPSGKGQRAEKKASALLAGAKEFLKDIRKKIGDENFEELVSINGEVTLVFVIDSTGSMSDDIEAAQAIAEQIVSYKREVPVNFILSEFNDPDVGPIIFRDKNSLSRAVEDLRNMTVKDGGDCPEMAFEGMLQALYYSPMPGSSMYVFTDASPKDDTEENMETVKALAIDLGIPIYFFARGYCGEPKNVDSFRTVAQDTGGLMFPLHNSNQIKRLANFVKQNLKGSATLTGGTVKNAKETKTYIIPVDDSIAKLVVTLTTHVPCNDVKLISPDKVEQNITNDLDLNIIFEVENPKPGPWIMKVPAYAGDHEYFVKTISKINIDFSYYYFKYAPRNPREHIPLVHPLIGEDAMVMIKISEISKVKKDSLQLKILYENGTDGGNYKIHSVGDTGLRFRSTLKLHEGPYKLQLSGKTKNGHRFTRLSTNYDIAKPFRLRVVYARQYTLPIGKNSSLLLVIENPFQVEKRFTFTVTDTFGYARPDGGKLKQRGPSAVFFKLRFEVPKSDKANVNKTNRVVIKAIGKKTEITSSLVLYLLVTDD